MKPSELLVRPEAWTQEVHARASDGSRVGPANPNACCWCLVGALYRCYPQTPDDPDCREFCTAYTRVKDKLRHMCGYSSIARWNDAPSRTHAEVLEVLKACDL